MSGILMPPCKKNQLCPRAPTVVQSQFPSKKEAGSPQQEVGVRPKFLCPLGDESRTLGGNPQVGFFMTMFKLCNMLIVNAKKKKNKNKNKNTQKKFLSHPGLSIIFFLRESVGAVS